MTESSVWPVPSPRSSVFTARGRRLLRFEVRVRGGAREDGIWMRDLREVAGCDVVEEGAEFPIISS
jgi:hypothetical protein